MKSKKIAASLLFLLSTSSYAMESAFILEAPTNQHVSARSLNPHVFSPLHRFLNDDFVSNLRFLCGQKSWNPAFSGHFQSILNQNFPIDSMTQFVQLLFPSPTGDYLVANQSTDIIAKTKASKFYDALVDMRTNGAPDVWYLFELLFDRQLSAFAKEIIIAEANNFYIEQYANAVKKEAAQDQISTNEAMEHMQRKGFFQDNFLTSADGKLFKTALKGGRPVQQTIQQALPKKLKNLKDTLNVPKLNPHKKSKIETELSELSKLGDHFVTVYDFQGYQIANAFVNAFIQEQNGTYSTGTLDRIIATYMWQKAETVNDLPFLSSPLVIDHDAMKGEIKALLESPELLQSYYNDGRYDVVWAYIYREKLMLDARYAPIIKYRTTTVDGHSIPDCFETAMHNAADFFCFRDGSFDPNVWKEGSELHKYFSELKYTTPNAPRSRSEWATAVANKKSGDTRKDVLYYTPSKKMNDVTNTIEAVPGIINMFKIMAHLGSATDATWEHIAQLETLPEAGAEEQLSASFQLLMTDLTGDSIVFDRVNSSAITKIQDRIAGHSDFTGNFYVMIKDKIPFEWEFMHKHSIFKCDAPTQEHHESVACSLSQLPLFSALKPHYTDLRTLITPEMSHEETTTLLMESDLRSPDLRREIMPILLESHLDLPFIKNILKIIEKEHDQYEAKEIIKIFNKNINVWLDDLTKRPIVMDLIRSEPNLFASEVGFQGDLEHRVLYRSLIERFKEKNDIDAEALAIELMQKSPSLCLIHDNDPIMPYMHYFKNADCLYNLPFSDKADELLDFTGFSKLERIGFQMSNGMQPNPAKEMAGTQALSIDKIDEFVQKMPLSINHISFNNINTVKLLSNAYTIFHKMKETRTELDVQLNTDIDFKRLIELNSSNPALFEWVAPKITSFCAMDFLQYEDQMHLFPNVTNISSFVIANRDGTLNRSIFSKLTRFNKLQYLSFSYFKYNDSMLDDTSNEKSFDVIIDQLPRSLQNISIYNLSSVDWDDFEPFMETLATRRPHLRIDVRGSQSILESRPRMNRLAESGRITFY